MHHHPFEIEINARYCRARIAAEVAATRPAPAWPTVRPLGAAPRSWLLRATGRRLIAAGERLAGAAITCPPEPRPVA